MIVAVWLPYFAAAIEARQQPDLKKTPFIITDPAHISGRVYAPSRRAAQRGIRPAMPLRRAQGLCPDAVCVEADHIGYQRYRDEVAETLSQFSQHLEAQPVWDSDNLASLMCYLDFDGLSHNGVQTLLEALEEAIRKQDQSPRIGIAANKFTAAVAARAAATAGRRWVAPGSEPRFLSPYSVSLAPVRKETLRRLDLLGLRSLGQIASLPARALFEQFGDEGLLLHSLAQGDDERPVKRYRPQRKISGFREFEPPADNLTVLQRVIGNLVEQAIPTMQSEHLAVGALSLTVWLDDATILDRHIRLREASGEPAHLRETLEALLTDLALTAAVRELEVVFANLQPINPVQLELFPHPRRGIGNTLTNLASRYGSENFWHISSGPGLHPLPERRFQLTEAAVT